MTKKLKRQESRVVIPTALRNDRCPRSCCDGCDAVIIVGEECPGVASLVDDIVVAFEDCDREFVAAQIFADIFDRVEFGCVGRQMDEGDVVRDGKVFGA
jgi:hypothetical protein